MSIWEIWGHTDRSVAALNCCSQEPKQRSDQWRICSLLTAHWTGELWLCSDDALKHSWQRRSTLFELNLFQWRRSLKATRRPWQRAATLKESSPAHKRRRHFNNGTESPSSSSSSSLVSHWSGTQLLLMEVRRTFSNRRLHLLLVQLHKHPTWASVRKHWWKI